MNAAQRQKLIDKYKAGYDQVVRALDGFPAALVTARPIAGKWTAAEIVHHLADSETQSAIRLRKLLAEPHPVIQAYDQEQWAKTLYYQKRPIEPVVTIVVSIILEKRRKLTAGLPRLA